VEGRQGLHQVQLRFLHRDSREVCAAHHLSLV
jgi:hypothetical protein